MTWTLAFIALAALAAVLLLLIYAATRPDTFCVQRSAVIKAPAQTLYALINDLRLFNHWSPYQKKDPGLQGSYSGAASGVGAAYAWASDKGGSGRLEIIATQAPNRVTMKLDLQAPFKAQHTADFSLHAQGDTTTIVTWAVHGPQTFTAKLIGVVLNTDSAIGRDFDASLADLKTLTEAR